METRLSRDVELVATCRVCCDHTGAPAHRAGHTQEKKHPDREDCPYWTVKVPEAHGYPERHFYPKDSKSPQGVQLRPWTLATKAVGHQ